MVRASLNRSPIPGCWADWIISGLDGRAINALHVAATGQTSVDRPILAIAPDPSHSVGLSSCSSVETNDLWNLADLLGASQLSIASPESRGVDIGARTIADSLGQMRPGPTLFSSLRRDPRAYALAQMCAFLADPSDRDLPSHPSWFGYIQPESIEAVLTEPLLPHHTGQIHIAPIATTGEPGTAGPPALSRDPDRILAQMFEDTDEVPTWVAASSRFLDTKHATLNNMLPPPGEGKSSKLAYDRGTSKALADIEAMIQRHAGDL
jgi:hypothetical protein